MVGPRVRATPPPRCHDLLQLFKTHPLVKKILEGGERVSWGAKALPGGGYWSMPRVCDARRAARRRLRPAWSTSPTLKGVHLAINSGILAAEAIYKGLKDESERLLVIRGDARRLGHRPRAVRRSRNTRQPFSKGFFLGGALVNFFIATKGKLPVRLPWHRQDQPRDVHREDAQEVPEARRQVHVRQARRASTSRATRRATTRRTTSAPDGRAARGGETWKWMCPAQVYVYEIRRRNAPEEGNVDVISQLHELRAVRRDHRQGRPPDARLRAATGRSTDT